LKGDFLGARAMLDNLLLEQGLSGEDVLIQLHRAMLEVSLPDKLKLQLLDRIGEVDFRLTEGANERIQLEALLAYFAIASEMK
jgi:replication factor C small subunit